MSIIKFSRWAIDVINSHMAWFLWNNSEEKHRYHLAHWQLVAQKKELGGLGISDLKNLNLSLLSSSIFRDNLHTHAIWTKIIDHKYRTNNPNIRCCVDDQAPPFWKGVAWALQAAHLGIVC